MPGDVYGEGQDGHRDKGRGGRAGEVGPGYRKPGAQFARLGGKKYPRRGGKGKSIRGVPGNSRDIGQGGGVY